MTHPGSDRFADVRSDECEEHFRWGRNANITINDDEGSVYIDEGKPSNKYDLSKLDTSEITNIQEAISSLT